MSRPISHVEWLYGAGERPFRPMPEWCAELRKQGMRCSHCEAIRQDAKERLSKLVLEGIPAGRDVGMVLLGDLVLRLELVKHIGMEKLERFCFSLPVVDSRGVPREDLRFFMERSPRAEWRGSTESRIGLCRECGRLLYWPAGERYLLRRYWNREDDITILDNHLLCSSEYFKQILEPHFPALRTESRALADDPQDGLPADYNDMIAEIRRRGWTR